MNKQQQKNKCILVNLRIILNASDIDEKKKSNLWQFMGDSLKP